MVWANGITEKKIWGSRYYTFRLKKKSYNIISPRELVPDGVDQRYYTVRLKKNIVTSPQELMQDGVELD